MGVQPEDTTELLNAASAGDPEAWNKLLSIVYRELHVLAHDAMRTERKGHTLQTTALVHEAYLRLVKNQNIQWQDRGHIFRAAVKSIRRILVDKARHRNAAKRRLGNKELSFEETELSPPSF